MSEPTQSQRLQKFIASCSDLSRRKAEDAISSGRVRVNGVVITEMGTQVDPSRDRVELDGRELLAPTMRTVVILHKPRRAITTKSDPQGRRTVMDLLPEDLDHLNPVGRLDYDSEGLLILTDDGDLANRIAHPSRGVKKGYQAWVEGVPSPSCIRRLCASVMLDDGPGKFENAEVIRTEAQGAVLRITVSEGRNRFVRRMLEAEGHPVTRLKRLWIGPVELGELRSGEFVRMSSEEFVERFPELN